MEVALVSAATGALKPVLGKLAALLGDKYKRFRGVRKEIKLLTDELTAMHNFLLKMSEVEDLDVQDKAWMNEVRELSYDMEDAIDDFMLCVDEKNAKPDGFMEKIKSSLGRMKARSRIGSEIQDLKKQIIEVGERNARYKTRVAICSTKNVTVDPRALAIFESASKLVGIDEPKNEIIKLLTEDDVCVTTQQQLKVVSIFGCGGMGKTTLANQVYQELKGQFDYRAILSVSRNPNMMNILRILLRQVCKIRYDDTKEGSVQQLIINITESLRNKRYFIVIDDIWDTDTWDIIKLAFPVTGPRSKLITTTRIKDVAQSCCSSFRGHIYNIRPLNARHSRQLFHRRLFNSEENCPSHLKAVSDQIMKKCDGLPLAIVAISGMLANTERTDHHWNEVKVSIGRTIERNTTVGKMMKILSLSYFDLPPHLKTCLLYLSIFPEGSIIKREGLIRRWIAEGFIYKEGIYTVYEVGEMCFNELVNRSLIQPMEIDKYDKVTKCRVHDTILDFIRVMSAEENFVTLVDVPNLTVRTQSKVRRLSLQTGKQGGSALPPTLALSHVRSLNVFGKIVEIPSLEEFKHLRILDFGGCYQLENHHLENIGRLFQLKYLNLQWTASLCKLPEQIGQLRCLEMLDLRYTRVDELPASIVNLGKLVHLLTDGSVKFPDGISKMQALGTLKRVGVFRQSLNFLQELGQLKNLRSLDLDFRGDSAIGVFEGSMVVKESKKAIASSLHNLGTQNLRYLTTFSRTNFLHGSLCPIPVSLHKLVICDSTVPRLPNWVGSLINLQHIRLRVEGVGQEYLRALGRLPSLLILDLVGTTVSRDGLRVDGEVGFQCLKQFCYDMTLHGMDLMFAEGSMPKLEKLIVIFDSDKTELLGSGAFDFVIENLPCLSTLTCKILAYMKAPEAAKAAMEKAARAHPNRPNLLFQDTW